MTEPILEVKSLRKSYAGRHGPVQAIRGVSLSLDSGQTLGLVGESGCGKSTLAACLQGVTTADGGTVLIKGHSLTDSSSRQRRLLRQRIGMVHQNPYASLDPKMRVGSIVAEPLVAVQGLRGAAVSRRVDECLADVDLGTDVAARFPHELSGGQRQRVAIARALALAPDLLILDEPTAALDVSVQARILNLLKDIQSRTGLGFLFITHNLAVVDYMTDRVLVMYQGCIVEEGPSAEIFARPCHPYIASLLAAVPQPDPAWRAQIAPLPGDLFDRRVGSSGCAFAPRCPNRLDRCGNESPVLTKTGANTVAACFNKNHGDNLVV